MSVYADYLYQDNENFSCCENPDMFEGFEDNSYACDEDYRDEDYYNLVYYNCYDFDVDIC